MKQNFKRIMLVAVLLMGFMLKQEWQIKQKETDQNQNKVKNPVLQKVACKKGGCESTWLIPVGPSGLILAD